MRRAVRSFSTLAVATLLSACMVHPNPISLQDLETVVQEDQRLLLENQVPVTGPIDLYEAIARALKYNLDYRVNLLEKTVALTEVDLSNHEMLPKLASNSGFNVRDSLEASTSATVGGAVASSTFSSSQDKAKAHAGLSVVWNVLDFGVSYFQAKQTANKFLISEENRRKLAHNQFQEVQTAFWRAYSAQQLQGKFEPVLAEAKQSLLLARQVEREGLRPQLEMMRYQRELLEIIQQLESLREELESAKKNLSLLINLPPGTEFTLKVADEEKVITPIRVTLSEMEQLALVNRPELRMEIYKTLISVDETHKALLRLLPGLEFKVGSNYDSNSYTMNSQWQEAGLQVTSNLMKVVSAPATIRMADNQALLGNLRRVALNMAIISQVHIGYRKYVDAVRRFDSSREINEVDQRILENISSAMGVAGQTSLDKIKAATRSIMSQLQRNKAFADAQNAVGMIYVSLGVDMVQESGINEDLPTLRNSVEKAVNSWKEGISLAPPPDTQETSVIEQEILDALDTLSGVTNKRLKTIPVISKPSNQDLTVLENPVNKIPVAKQDFLSQEEKDYLQKLQNTSVNHLLETIPQSSAPKDAQPAPVLVRPPAPVTPVQPAPVQPAPVAEEQDMNDGYSRATDVEAKPVRVHIPVTPQKAAYSVIKEWADAWTRQDIKAFLSLYSQDFVPDSVSKQEWEESYSTLLSPLTSMKTSLLDAAVEIESETTATAFIRIQHQTSKKWVSHKTLRLRKEDKWRIISEKTASK